jgi:hypothetical protein
MPGWLAAVHMQNSGYILPKWPRLHGITNPDFTDAVPNLLEIFPVGFLSGSGRPCNIRTVTNVPSVAQSTYVLVVAIIYKSCLCFQTLVEPSVRIAGITENIYIILPFQALSYRPHLSNVSADTQGEYGYRLAQSVDRMM